jgi:hypothetical protein
MRRALGLSGVAALAAAATLAAAPGAGAAPAAPPTGCDVAVVAGQPITITLAGQVYVVTPDVTTTVRLTGLVGTILCPLLGGTTAPAA